MPVRSAETSRPIDLVVQDFDGTIARTFEPSPNGVGVHEAYEIAIDGLFGPQTVQQYIDHGGLGNRAPLEVIKGIAPDATDAELTGLVDQLVQAKLAVLLDQIGTRLPTGERWPRPTAGYLEFHAALEEARTDSRRMIGDAVLSSGHEPFITKTFDTWGLRQPDTIVAEETIRALGSTLVKPSPELLELTVSRWRGRRNISTDAPITTIYAGDDPEKDGEMAYAVEGVEFVLVDPDESSAWERVVRRLRIGKHAMRVGGRWSATAGMR